MKKLRTILQSTHLLRSVQQFKDERQKEKNKTECYTWKLLSSFPSQFFHFQIFRQLSLHNSVQFSLEFLKRRTNFEKHWRELSFKPIKKHEN